MACDNPGGGTLAGLTNFLSGVSLDIGGVYTAINPQAQANANATVAMARGQAAGAALMPIAIVAGIGLLLFLAFRRN